MTFTLFLPIPHFPRANPIWAYKYPRNLLYVMFLYTKFEPDRSTVLGITERKDGRSELPILQSARWYFILTVQVLICKFYCK